MFDVNIMALKFWQYWDRVEWRGSTWRIIKIAPNFAIKQTKVRLVYEN